MIRTSKFSLYGYWSLLLLLLMAGQIQLVNAADPSEIQAKAQSAVQQLKQAVDEGKDVSAIVPMMKQVKTLGDQGKLDEVDVLLDEILIKFDELNGKSTSTSDSSAAVG